MIHNGYLPVLHVTGTGRLSFTILENEPGYLAAYSETDHLGIYSKLHLFQHKSGGPDWTLARRVLGWGLLKLRSLISP